MLPRWRALNETRPARVERILQSLMLGGAPLALPGLPMLKLRWDVERAGDWRGSLGVWLPKAAVHTQA